MMDISMPSAQKIRMQAMPMGGSISDLDVLENRLDSLLAEARRPADSSTRGDRGRGIPGKVDRPCAADSRDSSPGTAGASATSVVTRRRP
jgi:hypothetical protein